jgi:hypothetical protein
MLKGNHLSEEHKQAISEGQRMRWRNANREIVIQKSVPIPSKSGGARPRLYPFGDMKVGDSFFVPNGRLRTIGHCWRSFRKTHKSKWKFTARTVDGGVRCWRIA